MILDKAGILAASDLKREEVPVPEWGEGVTVLVSEMTGLRRMEFFKALDAEENKSLHYMSLALVFMIVNPDGSPMFTIDEVSALAGKSAMVLDRLYAVGDKLNKLSPAKAEAETKN